MTCDSKINLYLHITHMVSDGSLKPSEQFPQLYYVENKLHFGEMMMMMSTLF
jgi:hypothetical protein